MTIILIVAPASASSSSRGQLFDGMIDGREVVTRSTQPLLDGARALLAEGSDPRTRIMMRHAGSSADALRSTIGTAAQMTVGEGERPPIFRPWKPSPHAAVTPPVQGFWRE
jgi:hypothetical protein